MKKSTYFLLLFGLFINCVYGQSSGNSLNFDGNDMVTLPAELYNTNYSGKSAITIEYWYKGSVLSSPVRFQDGGNYVVAGWFYEGIIQHIISSDGGTTGISAGEVATINNGQWHHIAMTWAASGEFTSYLDGYVADHRSAASVSLPTITNGGWLGAFGASDDKEYLTGNLDEVRIWNKARTQSDIQSTMYTELDGNESGLVAYYKMSDASGTTLTDNSSNTYNGTISGATLQPSDCFTNLGSCLSYDGQNDKSSATLTGKIFNNSLTIELWINFNSLTTQHNFTGLYDGININKRIIPYKAEDNIINLYINDGSTAFVISSNYVVTQDKWYHLSFVVNNGTAYIYINGKLCNYDSYNPFLIGSDPTLYIGSDIGGFFSDVKIDEYRIWNTARTESEINDNMLKILNGNESGLVAYYRFNQSTSTATVYDATYPSFNQTISGMSLPSAWSNSLFYFAWTGNTSSDWNTVTNWNTQSLPTSTDIIYFNSNPVNNASISGNPEINSMYLQSGASVVLNSDITINGDLVLNNNLDLNGYNINLGSSGNLFENSGYLTGSTGSISTTRNLNNISSLNVAGLGAEITTASDMGSTTITRKHSLIDNSISRNYLISSAATELNATLVFHYLDNELNGLTEDDLALFKSTDNGSTWNKMGGEVETSENTITLSGINSFSLWTAGDKNSPLPVELTSFSAVIVKNKIELNWKTSTEINNYGFEIEKYTESQNWSKIGFVAGAGNSNTVIDYSYIDNLEIDLIANQTLKYRLKQIDNNGNFEYSDIVEVNLNSVVPTEYNLSQNYPNPFNPTTTIKYSIPTEGMVSLKVYDVLGKEVANLVDENKNAGTYEVIFNAENLSSGTYIYKLTSGNFTETKKLLLLK